MKLALFSLLGLVVFSNQQFYRQADWDRLILVLPYYSPRPTFDNYNHQPANYHYGANDRTAIFFNHLTPSSGIPTYPQVTTENPHVPPPSNQKSTVDPLHDFQDNNPYFSSLKDGDDVNDDQFADVQSRKKLAMNPFRSFFAQQPKLRFSTRSRILINLATRTNFLNKVKTITFTMTSSLTFTNVQSCIPTSEFSFGAGGVTCRRKRFVEPTDHKLGANQFAIAPSGMQPVQPTVVSSLFPTAEDGQHGNDPSVNYGVISSKEDDVLDALQSETPMPLGYLRDKRLFFHLVTTSTAISYVFLSTAVTKTVNLLNPLFGGGQLACLPEGYAEDMKSSVLILPVFKGQQQLDTLPCADFVV